MAKVYEFKKDKLDELWHYGTTSGIAKKLGITREHLSYVTNNKHNASYLLAFSLSKFAGDKDIDYYFKEKES